MLEMTKRRPKAALLAGPMREAAEKVKQTAGLPTGKMLPEPIAEEWTARSGRPSVG
jgi:hypothetical protein